MDFTTFARRKTEVKIVPRTLNQEKYVTLMLNPQYSYVVSTGPAGSGKTMLAVLAGLKAYKEGKIDKIILTRPAVGVDDEKHGFLPGDLNSKMEPWVRPLFDVIHEYYTPNEAKHMLESGVIEISPLAFMRGRTFKNAWIIADEMQNATPGQMKMLLTRLGEGSKMIVTGDINQTDRQSHDNGLLDFKQLIKRASSQYVGFVEFMNRDIMRHPAVADILSIYGE